MVFHKNCSWEDSVKLTVFVGLGICCLLQVKDSVEKYFSGQTTTTLSRVPEEKGTRFPSISLCASNGYLAENMDKVNMTSYIFLEKTVLKWPNNESEIDHAWKSITLPLDHLLHGLWVRHSGGHKSHCLLDSTKTRLDCSRGDLSVDVLTVDTLRYGRCYTIQINNHSLAGDNVVVHLSDHQNIMVEPVVFLHNRKQEVNLIADFWGVSPYFVPVSKRQEVKLSFAPILTHISEQASCDQTVTEDEYFECAKKSMAEIMLTITLDWVRQKYPNASSNGTSCTVPMYSMILPRSEKVPYCTSLESAAVAISNGREVQRGLQTRTVPGCKRPCTQTSYQYSEYTYSATPSVSGREGFTAGFLYISRVVDYLVVEKDVLLFDFSTIVGSVGGSLGLFIGFSFLQLSSDIIGQIFKCLSSKKNF